MSLTVLSNRAPAAETETSIEKAIDHLYELVKASIALVGGRDQAAPIMGIDSGDLTRALNRNGRYLTADHIMRLGAKLREVNPDAAQRLAVALVAPMDLIVYPRTQMTMAEMKGRLLAMLRRCPNGDLLIYQTLGQIDPSVQVTDAEQVRLLKEKILEFPLGEAMLREALATPAQVGVAA